MTLYYDIILGLFYSFHYVAVLFANIHKVLERDGSLCVGLEQGEHDQGPLERRGLPETLRDVDRADDAEDVAEGDGAAPPRVEYLEREPQLLLRRGLLPLVAPEDKCLEVNFQSGFVSFDE